MLTYTAAQEQILESVSPLDAELVELDRLCGLVLAEDLAAGRALPPWDNSAMDGYAVRAGEVQPGQPLPVAGVIAAGDTTRRTLPPGSALRIMTGAPMPDGADAVIMREEATETGATVRFGIAPAPGEHVRRAGEDMAPGEVVLQRGSPLGPGEVGLLAAQGRLLVAVHRRPLVAIVSTGDELVQADRVPGFGQIVGSNAHALAAQVAAAGGLPWVLPIAPDDRAALRRVFATALRADLMLSSGGVSVGEFDHVKEVLADLGVQERFWQVAMKPGKPLSFGVLPAGGPRLPVPVLGLPGNPASSMVSFELFVRPAIRRMLGYGPALLRRPRAPVTLLQPVAPDQRRLHFLRAGLSRDPGTGALCARPLARQGSGMLRSMVGVQALLEILPGEELLGAGTAVMAHLLTLV